jgi:hypothetical protein
MNQRHTQALIAIRDFFVHLYTVASDHKEDGTFGRNGESDMGSHEELQRECAMNAFPKTRSQVLGWIKGHLGLMAVLLVSAGAATGQTNRGPVTPNFRNADLIEVAMAVSAATGKNFIIDPRIHARVTIVSSTEMSPDAFYDAFLSVVRVHCWVAKTYGNVVTILPGLGCSPSAPTSPTPQNSAAFPASAQS